MPIYILFSNAFLDRFLVHFASELASPNPLKCVKNRCRDTFHLGLHFWINFSWFLLPTWTPWTQFGTSGLAPNAFFRVFWEIDVWSHFGANLAPFWDPKSTKIHAKIDSKRHPKNDRLLDRFFAQVGSILGPKLGPKSRSRRSQNASPNFCLIFQDATRTAQEPQEHPRSKFCPFLVLKSDGVPPPGLDFQGF